MTMNEPVVNPTKTSATKKRTFYTSEFVLYIIFGVIWLTGLVIAILGVCAWNVGRLSDNPLYAAQKGMAAAFGQTGLWDFRIVGTILMIFAMLCLLIAIYAYSNKATAEANEKRRKEERLRILMESTGRKPDTTAVPSATTPSDKK